jgi:hypothetical protein
MFEGRQYKIHLTAGGKPSKLQTNNKFPPLTEKIPFAHYHSTHLDRHLKKKFFNQMRKNQAIKNQTKISNKKKKFP